MGSGSPPPGVSVGSRAASLPGGSQAVTELQDTPFWANVFVLMKNFKTPLNLHHKEYENIIIKKLNLFQSLLCGYTQFVRRVGTKIL